MSCPEPPDVHVSHSKGEVADRDFHGLGFELRPTFWAYHQVLTELPAPGYFVQRSAAHPLARNCCENGSRLPRRPLFWSDSGDDCEMTMGSIWGQYGVSRGVRIAVTLSCIENEQL